MQQTIEDLRAAAAAVIDAADWLTQQFSTVADATSAITLEQVRAVLAEKARAGMTAQVRELLRQHAAAKLSDVDPARYAAQLDATEEMLFAT